MNLLHKLLDKTGLALIFKPRVDDEQERQKTIALINQSLRPIIESVTRDIETEKMGFFPHPENLRAENLRAENLRALNASADSLDYLQYYIQDKTGQRLVLPQYSLVSCNSIKMTENYLELKQMVNDSGYLIELREVNIDSDGVDTDKEPDEYTDDFERYFVIHISGW
jgi:hypothetical protein